MAAESTPAQSADAPHPPTNFDSATPVGSLGAPGVIAGSAIGEEIAEHDAAAPIDRPKVSAAYIWLVVLATFGAMTALVGPIGYSLAVLVDRIAPDNDEVLGYITGVGALTVVVLGPIIGILSDRTRSRIGRRRPWIIGLTFVGLFGLVIVGLAQNLPTAILGWAVTQFGFGIAALQLTSSQGDRLPASQRGKVAGLSGVAVMLAGIMGVTLASVFASSGLLLFVVPGAVGALLILLFAIFIKEPDARELPSLGKVSVRSVIEGYSYNVKKFADFSWNWLGRFFFNFGVDRGACGCERDPPRGRRVGGEGLLAQYVFARGDGPEGPLSVQSGWKRHIDGVDFGIG